MKGSAPEPPADLEQRAVPIRRIAADAILYRIHRASREPLFFGPPSPDPQSRFDDPAGVFKVCYLGMQAEAALVETLLREPQRRTLSWTGDIGVRQLARIQVLSELRLAELDGPGLRRLGATLEVLGTRDYRLPNAWSRAVWEHPQSPDGILYPCRHDNRAMGLALFERAQEAIGLLETTTLASEIRWLGEMATRYQFGLTP